MSNPEIFLICPSFSESLNFNVQLKKSAIISRRAAQAIFMTNFEELINYLQLLCQFQMV